MGVKEAQLNRRRTRNVREKRERPLPERDRSFDTCSLCGELANLTPVAIRHAEHWLCADCRARIGGDA